MSYKKYYVYKQQYSTDGGRTWNDTDPLVTSPSGDPIGEYATLEECQSLTPDPQYRWVNMDASVDYYCEGTTKYYKQKKQVSYDSGATWADVVPAEYQKGGVAQRESTDCGYVPPTPYENVFLFSDETSVKNISSSSAGGSMSIGIISYVNGVQTDLYSLVEKDMWIQYNSHTATSFEITIERNDTGEQRDGILSLKQNQTSKIITLNVHQN